MLVALSKPLQQFVTKIIERGGPIGSAVILIQPLCFLEETEKKQSHLPSQHLSLALPSVLPSRVFSSAGCINTGAQRGTQCFSVGEATLWPCGVYMTHTSSSSSASRASGIKDTSRAYSRSSFETLCVCANSEFQC